MLTSKRVNRKPYWAIAGILATVVFGIVGVYFFLHEKKPDISFEIVSEANVLDLHRPLKDLAIYFQEEDIQQKNLNLRVLTIRIENRGGLDILQSHFDQNIVWGFRITEGEIIDEVRLVNSNSEYLESNLKPKVIDRNTVALEKVILERGRYFTLEVLALHGKETFPEVVPIGKIVGIERIALVRSWQEKRSSTDPPRSFPIDSVLAVVAGVGAVIAFFAAIFLMDPKKGIRAIVRKKRRKEVEQVLQIDLLVPDNHKNRTLVNLCIGILGRGKTKALESLKILIELLEYEERLSEAQEHKLEEEHRAKRRELVSKYEDMRENLSFFPSIQALIESGILIPKENDGCSVDPEFVRNLGMFVSYLGTKN